jgi:AcrR family transcriptional regulator
MSSIAARREAEKDRRRSEIVDAAELTYREVGWDALTVDQVARTARLSRALVYVYFRDKSDLLLAVVDRAIGNLYERFSSAIARKSSGLSKVEAIGREYIAFAHETPHFFDAYARFNVHSGQSENPTSSEAGCLAGYERVHDVLIAALEAGIADGSIRSDLGDARLTAFSLWGFSHGAVQIATAKEQELSRLGVASSALLEHSIDLILKALARH